MYAFNVWHGAKLIDKVFYSLPGKIADQVESVKRSLINHDGLPLDIRVTWPKGQRVTFDYWELQGNYGQGWECLCAGVTLKEVKANRQDYRENEPGLSLRIVSKRERKESTIS
jgi:hypothetical protein